MSEVKVRVRVGSDKPPGKKGSMKACIPGVWALSKSVEGFVKFTHEVFSSSLDEVKGLMHVNILV